MNKYESNILSNIKNISYNFGSKSSKIINEDLYLLLNKLMGTMYLY